MTITTKDHPSETKADAATEPPSAPPQPERAGSEPDLESRIKLRRAELVGRLGELRAQVGTEVIQAGDRVKARLSEVAHIIKDGVVDGWGNLGDSVKHKLEHWLAETERSLAGHDAPIKNGRS